MAIQKQFTEMKQNMRIRTIDSVINKYNMYSPEITFNKYYMRVYRAFKKKFRNPSSVLHPCCFFDASPSKVFDNVTFVDGDENAMEEMRRLGLKAFEQDIRDYKPKEEHDLLILVRPSNLVAENPEWATQHLRNGGFVLTERDYGDAEKIYSQPSLYELCGGISDGEEDIFYSDSKRKPARAFRFNEPIDFRGETYQGKYNINWLIFKKIK